MVLDKLKINPGILALENPNQFLTVPKALVLIALISGKTFYYIFILIYSLILKNVSYQNMNSCSHVTMYTLYSDCVLVAVKLYLHPALTEYIYK